VLRELLEIGKVETKILILLSERPRTVRSLMRDLGTRNNRPLKRLIKRGLVEVHQGRLLSPYKLLVLTKRGKEVADFLINLGIMLRSV